MLGPTRYRLARFHLYRRWPGSVTQQLPCPPADLGPFAALPDPFHAGEQLSVFVSYIAGPDSLHCQLSANAAAVEQLETQIETASAAAGKVRSGGGIDAAAVGNVVG